MAETTIKQIPILFKTLGKYLTHENPKIRKIVRKVLCLPGNGNSSINEIPIKYLKKKYEESHDTFEEVLQKYESLAANKAELEKAFAYHHDVAELLKDFTYAEAARLKQRIKQGFENLGREKKKLHVVAFWALTVVVVLTMLLGCLLSMVFCG